MRALLISVLCLLLVIGIWFYFVTTAEALVAEARQLLSQTPLPAGELLSCWERIEFYYSVFSDSGQIHEARECLARALALLEQDPAAASAEFAAFRELLDLLCRQEQITPENII
ncbi:MAG: hypothetical protein E7223_08220 [Clostridiales bacterium]|nr:hypothetical protein [Clostridiales bacterium]